MYLGDFSTGSTVYFTFTSVGSSGAPAAFSSGGVTVYKNGSTDADTTGITLTSTFAGVTGQNHVQIDMAATSAFYDSGTFMAHISSGAFGSQDVTGYALRQWSINRKPQVTVSTAVSISTATSIDAVTSVSNAVSVSTASVIQEVTSVSNAVSVSTASVIQEVTDVTNLKSSDVKQQVIAALSSDTYAEPTGVPAATASLADKIGLTAAALRNQITVSSSAKVFYTDAGAVSWGKVLSQDSTGSTGVYTEAEASTST